MVLSQSPDPEERTHPSHGVASSTDRFLAVVHGTADFFWILAPTGEMHESDPSWQSFTGQQESDSLKRGWLDAVYPAERPQVEEMLHQSTLSAQPAERVCHMRRSDGVYRLVHVRVFPVCGRERSIGELVVCGTDITSEQMNEEQLHLAVEASGVGLWDQDLMTHQVVMTDHCKALFGVLPTTAWTLHSFLAAVHPADRERYLQIRTHALCEQRDMYEDFRTIWPDGSIHWLTGRARCICDVLGQPIHLVGAMVDITELKQSERQKDLLLGMTSHELKTPLTTLRATLQLAGRRLKRITSKEPISPEWKTFAQDLTQDLEDAVRQIDVQTRWITDLLDVSRITTNTLKLELRRCELGSIVRETVEDLRVTVPERMLLLEVPEQTTVNVLADRDRISQVLTNYVTNALRYASPSQPIVIGLTIQEDTARVWVRDKGPGLTEEEQTHIWQPYHQVKGVPVQSGEGEGLGLGLAICQALIAQHQGACGVESVPGQGSTFWFTLPIVNTRANSNG